MKCAICGDTFEGYRNTKLYCSSKCYLINKNIIRQGEKYKQYHKQYRKRYNLTNKYFQSQKRFKNSEKRKEYIKGYQSSEKFKQSLRRYANTPLGKKRDYRHQLKRRECKNNCLHNFTIEEWKIKLEKTKGICSGCYKNVGIVNLTIDHIFPLSKANDNFKLTGIKKIYTINDVQPLCRSCNSIKRCKIV